MLHFERAYQKLVANFDFGYQEWENLPIAFNFTEQRLITTEQISMCTSNCRIHLVTL